VLLPTIASSHTSGGALAIATAAGIAIVKVAALAVLVLLVGGRAVPWILTKVARTKSRELFTLAVLAIALAVATGAARAFGVSVALGAFLAGMVVGQSSLSHQAASDAIPMRDAFAVLFFVSVGMLFDPGFIVAQPALVAAVLAIILLLKPLVALALVLLLGYSVRTALVIAVGLAQIGEFSFILADVSRKLELLPEQGHTVLVACAVLSIGLNPFLFRAIAPLEAWLRRRRRLWAALSRGAEARGREANLRTTAELARPDDRPRAIIVGYGRVGQAVAKVLRKQGLQPVIIEIDVDLVAALRRLEIPAIYGDAAGLEILKAAGVDRARYLVVTPPDLLGRIPVIVAARELNPELYILVRARFVAERATLEEFGVSAACYDEQETAVGLGEILLRAMGLAGEQVTTETAAIRAELSSAERELPT
jgi:CPA2 family monovalent cation:H+ antiporter-2